tara:strand:+ start:314 stop:562 length:249 start_codon:yes stop_codon:yes gene_type:complete
MKTELSKIAKDLEQGTISEVEAQTLLLGLFSVVGSLPTNKDIASRAETYAYKTRKNFSGYEQVLMKIAYHKGCYWMRKKSTK